MTTPAEFERVLRRPAVHRDGPFALHVCPAEAGSERETGWRLGLVIPKRYEASAVARNTIKRRWRDAFRRGRIAWAAEFGGVDLVVRLQSPLVPKPSRAAKGRPVDAAKAGKTSSREPLGSTVPARDRVESTASVSAAIPGPLSAKRRARLRFDPSTTLAAMAERLRRRTPRPSGTKVPS